MGSVPIPPSEDARGTGATRGDGREPSVDVRDARDPGHLAMNAEHQLPNPPHDRRGLPTPRSAGGPPGLTGSAGDGVAGGADSAPVRPAPAPLQIPQMQRGGLPFSASSSDSGGSNLRLGSFGSFGSYGSFGAGDPGDSDEPVPVRQAVGALKSVPVPTPPLPKAKNSISVDPFERARQPSHPLPPPPIAPPAAVPVRSTSTPAPAHGPLPVPPQQPPPPLPPVPSGPSAASRHTHAHEPPQPPRDSAVAATTATSQTGPSAEAAEASTSNTPGGTINTGTLGARATTDGVRSRSSTVTSTIAPASAAAAQYHPQTMTLLTNNTPSAPGSAPHAPSAADGSLRSLKAPGATGTQAPAPTAASVGSLGRTRGPRPLPRRMPSNLAPATNGNDNSNSNYNSSNNSVLAPPTASVSPISAAHTGISAATTQWSVANTDTSRRTDIPLQTIRQLEATLKDLADLPTTAAPATTRAPAAVDPLSHVPPIPTAPFTNLSDRPSPSTSPFASASSGTPQKSAGPLFDPSYTLTGTRGSPHSPPSPPEQSSSSRLAEPAQPLWTKGSVPGPDLVSSPEHFEPPSFGVAAQALASSSSGGSTPPGGGGAGPTGSAASTMSRATGKPKGPRLSVNTLAVSSTPNLADTLRERERDRAPLSPGMKHWQQVRQHVLAPTPPEERNTTLLHPHSHQGKTHGLGALNAGHKRLKYVTKAVERRFGFRNAVENVMGVDRRGSTFGGYSFGPNLSAEEREEASRQRRKFARDIKQCLDACGIDESKRRLSRMAPVNGAEHPNDMMPPKNASSTKAGKQSKAPHVHYHGYAQGTFVPQNKEMTTSTYAPLLTELHRYLPDARAKRVWSRTCPHHATILAELGVTFLQDSVSTDAERIQALEVFGTVVRNWATDSADEELDRWLWLCRAMLVNDKMLRARGLSLLSQMLRRDPALPEPPVRPMTADDFDAVAIALIRLLHALENSPEPNLPQQDIVANLLSDLSNGEIIKVLTHTLSEVPDDVDKSVQLDTLERELLWMAAGRALSVDQEIATWLLAGDGTVLKRYSPPPILRATAPVVLCLRELSATQFFASLSTVIRRTSNLDLIASVADTADFVYEDAHAIGNNETSLVIGYVTVLLDIELKRIGDNTDDSDPFSDSIKRSASAAAHLRLLQLLKESRKEVMDKVAEQLVASYPMTQRLAAVRYFLESDLAALGTACVPYILQRLTPASGANKHVKPFLTWLSRKYPQLFYKPLFICSAAKQLSSLRVPLRTIDTMTKLVGPAAFWMQADPQMVIIVLTGGSGAPAKKMSDRNEVAIKPGRYATMLELVLALQSLKTDEEPKNNLRAFLATVETGLAASLEIEERQAPLPMSYRSLCCQLFISLRNASKVIKRTAAVRLAVSWFVRDAEIPRSAWLPSSPADDDQVSALRDLLSVDDKDFFLPRFSVIDRTFINSLTTLLVTVQASVAEPDWRSMLPPLWERFSLPREPNMQLAFLLTKCAEQIPDILHTLVLNELFRSTDSSSPNRTLLKLAMLYGFRYQLRKQNTIAGDRGVFKFPGKVFEFVATEMGSEQWVVPQDALDQALHKYGRSLPLELRQRLMELGWNEEKNMSVADYERIPVTLIPLSELNESMNELDTAGKPPPGSDPKPSTALKRTISNSSGNANIKARRPVLPPILLKLINQQGRVLYTSDDINVAMVSYELVHMVEREDPRALIRPINDALPFELENIIKRINMDIAQTTPSFAHAVINSLVGYLKVSVRDNPHFPYWQRILSTICRVVPRVSEMSLRDIRKSKAEQVLLPGSVYEDGAGFKLHQPWQNDNLAIQTAQLVLLIELLRVNPRDVYLIKKLLFNLQVQGSFVHLPFARAWLELVVQLFTGLNSNYNDRAEFRHFLNNISMVLALHGRNDIIVATQAMRAISVCAVRFRRVFASIGFLNIMRVVYETYVYGHVPIKDCIEYAMRSIYRIHRDVFVYQTCLALADDPVDPEAAYNLLAALAVPNGPRSGVASGIRGLNDRQEVDALMQMMSSGAAVSLSELRSSAEERHAHKAVHLNLDPLLFPRDNIIRLLVTVIAVNAGSPRALKLMRLFAVLVPYMTDRASKELLPDGVDAIGRFIHKEKLGDDQYMLRLLPGEETTAPNWTRANEEYVLLVDAAVKHGCSMSVHATRRLLDIVLALLQTQTGPISYVASSVLGSLTRTHLAGRHPAEFLRDIAPTYRQSLATVDFSGVLGSITDLIVRSHYDLPLQTATLVTHEYVAPVIRMLAFASEESMAFIVPVRTAAVELLAASVFLPGSETLDVLESVGSSPGLLASVTLPLVLLLDKPRDVNRDEAYTNFWIRMLRIVLHPLARVSRGNKTSDTPLALAATAFLSLQIVKVIVLRAPECVSAVPGLWSYIAAEVLKTMADGDGRFFYMPLGRPRVVDWMMWSFFELLVLHRTPLHIDCRLRIQTALAKMHDDDDDSRSRRSSVASDGPRPSPIGHSPSRSLSGHVRRPSARPGLSISTTPITPNSDHSTPIRGHQRNLSASSGPFLSPATPATRLRNASGGSATSPGDSIGPSPIRPSFADLSARRASRPALDVFPDSRQNRFPSSIPARTLDSQSAHPTIVHLLGPANQLASTANAALRSVGLRDPRRSALKDIRLVNPSIVAHARRTVATVMAVYGYDTGDEEPVLTVWNQPEALHAITEQTKLLVEEEFHDVFNPPSVATAEKNDVLTEWTAANLAPAEHDEKSGDDKDGSFYTAVEKEDDDAEHPSFSFTLQRPYDEPSFQTFKLPKEGDGPAEAIAVPTLSISQFH